MHGRIASAVLLVCSLVFSLIPKHSSGLAFSGAQAELLALHEAEILIYLLPDAFEIRKQGMDIGWELQTGPDFNQKDFFVFWVVNAKRPNVDGSVTLGYYAVNRHTADVWVEVMDKFVVSKELEAVQKILRQAHHIDEVTITRYRPLRP